MTQIGGNPLVPSLKETPRPPQIIVIGAGVAGILTGIELQKRGWNDYIVLEKASTLGGTWRDNVYPGVACDVPAHYYCFSFAPNPYPARRFATGAELWRYFDDVARSQGVSQHIRYHTEVTDARWDGRRWTVTTADGERLIADVVISAVGRLQQPKVPDIPGLSDFTGPVFHSARWDPAFVPDGKRLGLIGTGSSATQITAALASRVAHLDLFQRTAQWVIPWPNTPLPRWRRLLLRVSPAYRKRYRASIERDLSARSGAVTGDNPAAATARDEACLRALDTVRDPVLRAKLTPNYAVGCKRLVVSGTFYEAVQNPAVSVVTDPIDRVEAQGVRTADGTLHELDALVLATGFRADAYLRPMRVTGEDGTTLDDLWAELPMNYKSVALPRMPNFFMINGPFSPGGSASVLSIIETHVSYVMKVLDRVVAEKIAIAPHPQRSAELLLAIRERASQTVWATGGCTSWYLDRNGIPLVNPVLLHELQADMAEPDFADFLITSPADDPARAAAETGGR